METCINTFPVKMEAKWDHSEAQHFSGDNLMYKKDKPEPTLVQSKEKINQKNEDCVLDCGSTEFSSDQLEISIKTENIDSKSDRWSEVVQDDFKIKKEEFDSKEEVLTENEKKCREFFAKQLLVSIKTDNCETKSEIDQWPEVVLTDWKIKNEEIDFKEEGMLEIVDTPSMIPGHCSEPKHDDYKKFKCHLCDYKTKRKGNIKLHLVKHKKLEEVVLLSCDKCKFVTRYKNVLKRHMLRHIYGHRPPDKVNLFGCDKCEYKTYIKHYLKRHFLQHKNPEEVELFGCDKCNFQTRYKSGLKSHAIRHKKPEELNLFKCDQCDHVTRYKSGLRSHALRHKKPEEVDLFKCDQCEYRTRYRSALNSHVLRHKKSEEVDLFKCNHCKYQTCYRRALQSHVLRHKKPEEADVFKCDKCEYRSVFKKDFKKHSMRHKTQ